MSQICLSVLNWRLIAEIWGHVALELTPIALPGLIGVIHTNAFWLKYPEGMTSIIMCPNLPLPTFECTEAVLKLISMCNLTILSYMDFPLITEIVRRGKLSHYKMKETLFGGI